AKNQDAIKRTKLKIEENKGKFPMASIPIEGSPERHERINNSIEELLNKGDLVQLLLAIAGYGVFSKSEDLKNQAVESAKKQTLVNLMTIQTSDKFGNTVRVYRTEEEKTIYHLFNSMNISSQLSIQVIGSLLSGAIRRDILHYGHFEEILNISWLAKEIEWFNGGNTQKVKTLDAVLPGVRSFINELTSAIKVEGYQPDFTCCTDSMTIKIEYILRHLCKHLKKPTFKFVFEGDTMLADEKPMSGLLIELEDFLREDDILWIKFLMNEKGGFNFRNRVCHGLVDGNEYGYTNALFAFVIILRLSHYNLDEE
ncbi:DUF4209 domain-containing protein, partial [Fluviicola sp.]|uniref:DUF4209 domain-containing protein n=1 Tax=Fluviicola sp. TaxID=1917219 RepID=UPI0026132A02